MATVPLKTRAETLSVASPKLPDLPRRDKPWPEQGEWTYADYLQLPDDGRRYEVIEGVLYVTPSPTYAHQYVVQVLLRRLGDHVEEQELGIVLTAPFEVNLGEQSRPVQPDLLFVAADRLPAPDAGEFTGAPDLVVEVLSPSTARRDRLVKFAAYERAGVPEYWIVNPHTRAVEVYALGEEGYELAGQYVGEETIASPTLSAFAIRADEIFPKPD